MKNNGFSIDSVCRAVIKISLLKGERVQSDGPLILLGVYVGPGK